MARKAFPDDTREERKQVLMMLEEGLTNTALSSLYLQLLH